MKKEDETETLDNVYVYSIHGRNDNMKVLKGSVEIKFYYSKENSEYIPKVLRVVFKADGVRYKSRLAVHPNEVYRNLLYLPGFVRDDKKAAEVFINHYKNSICEVRECTESRIKGMKCKIETLNKFLLDNM